MDNSSYLKGSICLSDIPKELIKDVMCKDGIKRKYLNIAIMPKKNPTSFTNENGTTTYTHYITCAPPKEYQKDGVKYFIGDLSERSFNNNQQSAQPQQQPQANNYGGFNSAPAEADEDLPF